ncbi:MAG: tetratricopeptide repeat protein [Candidatus Peribacteraceae bacterium]
MIYIAVFTITLLAIAALFGGRIALRHRSVRRFVRSVRERFDSAEERGAELVPEVPVERPRKNPRMSAIQLQQVRTLLRAAEKEVAMQRFADAESLLIQALTVLPDSLDAQAELAKLYLTTERYAKAEALYQDIVARRDDVGFYANLGLANYMQGKYVEACYAYQEALNRDPQTPERSAALSRACIAARRYKDAAPLLEKALTRLSKDTELLHLLAECYLQLEEPAKAEEVYRRINRIEPYNEGVKQKISALAAKGETA